MRVGVEDGVGMCLSGYHLKVSSRKVDENSVVHQYARQTSQFASLITTIPVGRTCSQKTNLEPCGGCVVEDICMYALSSYGEHRGGSCLEKCLSIHGVGS